MGKTIMSFIDKELFGVEVSIDLKGCNPEMIKSERMILAYIVRVCDLIEAKRFGDPTIVNFGEGEKIAGYSFTQLIETSLVSGHLVDSTGAAYINVFSCKYFDPVKVVEFTKGFFGAKEVQFITNYRNI